MNIIKRSGKVEKLSKNKIFVSICNANGSIKNEENKLTQKQIKRIADSIYAYCENIEEPIDIDTLEDLIEHKIMENSGYEVAKRYITYRYEKERVRNIKSLTEKLTASNVQNQNANVDEFSFGGRTGETAAFITKEYALNNLISKKTAKNHNNNEIYIHDLDSYAVGSHNCLSIPFDKLLKDGFTTRQTDVRPASSINTAFQLVAVIFQLQSLQQFGGVAATHLDWTMVPYIRLSFWKHYWNGMKYIEDDMDIAGHTKEQIRELSINADIYNKDSKAYKYAMDNTVKELEQAVEGMYHNLNTLQSRSGNQLPFTSINYGTCTSTEGRMVIKALLDGSIKGVGKFHKTAIFPCGIFQCMEGVNRKEGEPNYDLFKLALKSTSLRLYPNYANTHWSGNEGYDKDNPMTYFSTMGALDGCEHINIRINDGSPIDISIKDFFELCNNGLVDSDRKMKLYYNNQERIAIDTNTEYDILDKAGVFKITDTSTDVSNIFSSSSIKNSIEEIKNSIETKGAIDGWGTFNNTDVSCYKFEVLEYADDFKHAEEKYITVEPLWKFSGFDHNTWRRANSSNIECVDERPQFEMDSNVPQDFIDLKACDIKVLDVSDRWVKINHVFRNDKMNTPLMMHISYTDGDSEYTISCTEDHPLMTDTDGIFTEASKLKVGDYIINSRINKLKVTGVRYSTERVDSYDIGTETGMFTGSDIVMHNCRTANGYDINAEDPKLVQLKDGRGNICPTTIIMPTLAMQAKNKIYPQEVKECDYDTDKVVDAFMKLLDKKIGEAKDSLIERFDWICSQPATSAKFMYENGTIYGYKPEEGIKSALKHGTLAIGQLGLAETLHILIGCDHTTKRGMELAKRIESLFKEKCAKFKKEYKLNFGVYFTPAENLCFTAMKKFKEMYGEIKNVSDHDYFTNSMHVPVWYKMNPFKKIDIESQLTGYSSAGCITYVELDSSTKNNTEALEDLVNYAMDRDIPYFAINIPNDTCNDCGYTDDISESCPMCGSKDIQQLRRVTGYLSTTYKHFNKGKIKEVEDRTKHSGVKI